MLRNLLPVRSREVGSLNRLEREMENLFDRFGGFLAPWSPVENEPLFPNMNVAETESAIEVSMELPGMKAEDFKVDLRHNELWITGEKKKETEEKGKSFHRIERQFGTFERMIRLPVEVKAEKIEATYKDGVLHVVVPKAAAIKPKHIEVKS